MGLAALRKTFQETGAAWGQDILRKKFQETWPRVGLGQPVYFRHKKARFRGLVYYLKHHFIERIIIFNKSTQHVNTPITANTHIVPITT